MLLPACCGEAYIATQVASILLQLGEEDELIISDDSPEMTMAFSDPRVKYIRGPRQGTAIKNVEFLLGQAGGEIIVLSDQDDVWLPGKLERTREKLDTDEPALLHHNAVTTDEHLRETGRTKARPGLWRNWLKNSYTGCCMAFTRALLPHVLPFPEGIPMHDQWIGLRAEQVGRVEFLDEPLLLWRRHGATQTGKPSGLKQKIVWRAKLARALMKTGKRGGFE